MTLDWSGGSPLTVAGAAAESAVSTTTPLHSLLIPCGNHGRKWGAMTPTVKSDDHTLVILAPARPFRDRRSRASPFKRLVTHWDWVVAPKLS